MFLKQYYLKHTYKLDIHKHLWKGILGAEATSEMAVFVINDDGFGFGNLQSYCNCPNSWWFFFLKFELLDSCN